MIQQPQTTDHAQDNSQIKVVVGMSGGVDSSVSAELGRRR
jgi:NH3-dependent NAD+ synthetase